MAEVAEWMDQVDGVCQVSRLLDKSRTDQWMKAEQIAVTLGITRVYAALFGVAALSRALALGGDPTPPL